jgi:hypothetical protein
MDSALRNCHPIRPQWFLFLCVPHFPSVLNVHWWPGSHAMPSSASASFSVSYDRTSQVISSLVSLAVLVSVVAAHNFAVGCLASLALALAYAYSPLGYIVSQQSIIVRRLVGNATIPLEGVQEVRVTTSDDMRGCIRLWGSGGLFGYYGWFRTSKLGRSIWYVTNRKKMIVVRTGAKTALFSPDEVDGFLASLRAAAPIREIPSGESFGAAKNRGLAGVWIAAAAASAGFMVAVFVMTYAPGPPSYTLTAESLTIHDRFYPVTLNPDAVDVGGIRVVDIGQESDWRPALRTNGFANRHYRSGWFRLAGGKTARMYQADGSRLVLLPPKGAGVPVLLEVQDPEKFVRVVQQEWSGRPITPK